MEHLGTKTLTTDRLILRRYELADAAAMYENWASDPLVTEYLTWPCHDSVKTTEGILSDWIREYQNTGFYNWAIVLKEEGPNPIGNISVVKSDDTVKMAQIGYCIGQKWWNKGIVSEALQAVIHYLFTEVKVNRIEARHDPNNPGSGKVMLKCGLQYEGTLREADCNNQGICDCAMYAILAKEYQAGNN